ncbi:MAG: YqaA family protein [Siculibacillus sp.]
MIDLAAPTGLFLAAFVSATILPMQSEAVLVGLLLAGTHDPWLLVTLASIGNIGGSVVNWAMGRGIERYHDRRWFPIDAETLEKAGAWYRRWGKWSLLGSWVPFVGDPLTVVAGVLREPFGVFLLLVTIGKVARYTALAAATLNWA